MLGCGQETSSGLKLYLTDNSWKKWWKENLIISRHMFEHIVGLVGLDLAKKDTALRKCIPVNKQVAVAFGNWRHIQIYGPAIWHWKMCNNALKS